jgi:hypothetical protein
MSSSNLTRLLLLLLVLLLPLPAVAAATTHTAANASSSTSSSSSLSFSAPGNTTIIVTENDIKTGILENLAAATVVDFEIFENGKTVATFQGLNVAGDISTFIVEFNSTLSTDKQSYRIEDGRVFSPDGDELKIVLGN